MIKGHVCIDLHNHNSGFTERIEKDNTVTNALKIAYPLYERANKPDSFFPIWKKALGGLLIFKDKLNDSLSNTHIPSDNDIIGMAGNKVTTSSGTMGSLNTGESGSKGDPNSYTTVWDFATNQANGKISALARTHLTMGNGDFKIYNNWSPDSDLGWSYKDSRNWYCPFAYDKTTDELFFARFINKSVIFSYQRIDLFKRRILTDTPGDWNSLDPEHDFLTISYDDAGLVDNSFEVYIDDDYFYIKTGIPKEIGNNYNKYGLHVTKFNIPDLMKKPSSISNVAIKKVFTPDNYPKPTDMGADSIFRTIFMHKGKIYIHYGKNNKHYYASYSLDSGSLLDAEALEGPSADLNWTITTHNNLLFEGINPETLKFCNANYNLYRYSVNCNILSTYQLYDYDNNLLTGLLSHQGLCYYPEEYLGTIFNFDEPITKTESTSMKVTYTLSNV